MIPATQFPDIYGLLAEFPHAGELVAATRGAYAAGYRQMEAYTPFPVEDLPEALGHSRTRLPWLVFVGGTLGLISAVGMMYYAAVIDYPLNIGGRPYNSWPIYIPITFELTVLGAALFGFFGMLALNGLPHPYHPLFHVAEFKLASRDKFFLCIQSRDPQFDPESARRFLSSVGAHAIYEVPP